MNLLALGKLTEDQARAYMENIRWPNGPQCPHCNNDGNEATISPLKGKAHRVGLYFCGACRKQFSVTVGTVMDRSHLTMKKWLVAFHLMSSSKKGISALQMQRELGIKSYKSAWFLCHRIRAAMENKPLAQIMKGTVEVDETYIGGKPRKGNNQKIKRGRGTKKTPVMVLVSRNGEAYAKPVERVNAKQLKGAIRELVHKEARIITDEWKAYNGIGKEFEGGHEVVNHGEGEYVRGDVHTNTAESYFALLKRGVTGAFHHVSKKHLHRYCDEFSFRWTNRKAEDSERMEQAIKQIGGKRLVYKIA